MNSQNAMILGHLKRGGCLTGLDALRLYGVSHLPRRILDLKERGYNLHSIWVYVEKGNGRGLARVKEWRLAPVSDAAQ